MVQRVAYDDEKALYNLVSEEFSGFGTKCTVTQEMISSFADTTLDQQWIHTDTARARIESPFGTTIAHGFLTLSLATALQPRNTVAIVGYGSAINYGIDNLRFLAPVLAGSTVHARARFSAIELRQSGTLVSKQMAIHVVDNEKPSLIFDWKLLYRA